MREKTAKFLMIFLLIFLVGCAKDINMLFVFDDDAVRVFWMKNTLIPLDIIFIDGNFDIVGIKRATPCKAEPCELYESSRPAKYVLEVNGNFTEKNSISVGDKIIVGKSRKMEFSTKNKIH